MNDKSIMIIAEAGVNHDGDPDKAFALVDVASEAGSDSIKFQTFRTDLLVSKTAPKASYQKKSGLSYESQHDMLSRLELSNEVFRDLKNYSESKGLKFMSTAFDADSLSFLLDELELDLLKIPSGEITNGPFLLRCAKARRKMIISTGMTTLDEVRTALAVVAFGYLGLEDPTKLKFKEAFDSVEGKRALKDNVILLHCTTEYPAALETINLRAMENLKEEFELEVGYSDHSEGILVSCAAAALGAKVIEKHFTLDKRLNGPDHAASLEPQELANLVESIRSVEVLLGSGTKHPQTNELNNKLVARKGIVATTYIHKGELFSDQNITIKRPENGLSPMRWWEILGTKATRSYSINEPIT